MAERLKQRPAQRVGQRPHGLRVGQVELQPIVARPLPILSTAGLSSAARAFAARAFAGLISAGLMLAARFIAGLSSAGLSSAGPISAGPILAARFIASPACARLRFIGPIFGSHVSKDYSRKSRFDKSSKHFFREISTTTPTAVSIAQEVAATGHNGRVIDELIARMAAVLGPLEADGDQRRYFHATYQRTTIAVAEQIKRGGFADPGWVERWDVAFADLYLDALETALAGQRPARPWDIAFSAPAGLPPLRHVLLGMNAHINYDLPQALLAVITDAEFGDAALLARREADHQAIDGVLASRVGAEDDELARLSGPPPLLDRLLRPFNRLGTQRFLREARVKVWANAITLNRARRQGPDAYAARLAQLEELSAAKVADLKAPGQVLLKLAATGFGVRLPG